MRENPVKRALYAGDVQVGTWIHNFAIPNVARVLATAGFDYAIIDMEHSAFSIDMFSETALAARDAGMVPLGRPSSVDPSARTRLLDNGAMGLVIPHVNSREEAEAAVRVLKFPPLGTRSSQPPNPNSAFALVDAPAYMAKANEETMTLVCIESRVALANLDEILSTPGVDGATVGRGDLAADLGLVGGPKHPVLIEAVGDVVAACLRNGRIPGLLVQDPVEALEWIDKGVRLVTLGGESTILRNAAAAAIGEIRAGAGPKRSGAE